MFKVQMEVKMSFSEPLNDPEMNDLAKTIKETFVLSTGAPPSYTGVFVRKFTSGRRRLLSYYYKAQIVSKGLSEAKANQIISTSNSIVGPIKKNLEAKFKGVTVAISQSAKISKDTTSKTPTKASSGESPTSLKSSLTHSPTISIWEVSSSSSLLSHKYIFIWLFSFTWWFLCEM